jgi:hypothetical protein
MLLSNLFRRWHTSQRQVPVSREMAIAASRQVWQNVAHLHIPYERAEARGYIRAKTTPIVEAHLNAFYAANPKFDTSVRAELGANVTERVVRLVADEFTRVRALAATQQRRAA